MSIYPLFRSGLTWCFFLISNTVFSGDLGSLNASTKENTAWLGTLSAGPGWSNNIAQQTFFLEPGVEKTYTTAEANRVLMQGEVFIGKQFQAPYHAILEGGLSLGGSSTQGFSGQIWEDANPVFNNYNYDFSLTHSYLAVSGKIYTDALRWKFEPYFRASLGVAWNRLTHFGSSPLISEEVTAPAFACNTTSSFTYIVGVGLQKAINLNWRAGVEYTFSDWGSGEFAVPSGQNLSNVFSFSGLNVNSLMFNITYLA